MMLTFQWIVTAACVGLLANGLLNLRRVARDRRLSREVAPPAGPPLLISVCVPARNEERNIGACLESLARQDCHNYEVLALDDQSTDRTGQIAREAAASHPHVHLIAGEPLPSGWIGKAHACRQLADRARGKWILFTDADTVYHPRALSRTLALARARRADLLTGMPRLHAVTFWERLSVPMVTLLGFSVISFALASRPGRGWFTAGCGAFLFFRREAYEAFGGHRAVRRHIVEDMALARLTQRSGGRVVMADVSDRVACRMYRSGPEVWEGVTKNINAAFPYGLILPALLGLAIICVWPWFCFLFGPAWGWGSVVGTWLPLAQIVSIGALRVAVELRVRTFRLSNPTLTPLCAIFIALVGLRSWSRSVLRQSTPWRGRRYELWK